MWVHNYFTTWARPFKVEVQFPWKRCLCVYVFIFSYVCVSHLSQNVDMATHLANKFANVLKHPKPILLPSSKCHNQICYHTP
jgi:hypothetical protein